MPDAFIKHLFYNFRITWVFALIFVMWPLVFGLGASALSTSSNGKRLSLSQAIRRSVSSYLGFDKEAVPPGQMVLHRIVGALAWAYVVAIFISSIG
jgi:hypothetical protein